MRGGLQLLLCSVEYDAAKSASLFRHCIGLHPECEKWREASWLHRDLTSHSQTQDSFLTLTPCQFISPYPPSSLLPFSGCVTTNWFHSIPSDLIWGPLQSCCECCWCGLVSWRTQEASAGSHQSLIYSSILFCRVDHQLASTNSPR